MGSLLVIEYLQTRQLAGRALTLIVATCSSRSRSRTSRSAATSAGSPAAILSTLALARFGRGRLDYGPVGLVGVAGVALIGLASIAVAYWRSWYAVTEYRPVELAVGAPRPEEALERSQAFLERMRDAALGALLLGSPCRTS